MRLFKCLPLICTVLLLSSCAHLQSDEFPLGLGTHPASYISGPANVGGGVGLVVGGPLALALFPITLPLGYAYNGSGGAFAFFVSPAIYTSYGVGALFGSLPYFVHLPFEEAPLYDSSPDRRFRAIRLAGEQGQKKAVPRLLHLLKNDEVIENRQEAARALAKMEDENLVEPLVNIFVKSKDPFLRYYCLQALSKITPSLQPWLELVESGNRQKIYLGVLLLAEKRTRKALEKLVEMLDGPYKEWAWEGLRRSTGLDLGKKPSPWKEWLQKQKFDKNSGKLQKRS